MIRRQFFVLALSALLSPAAIGAPKPVAAEGGALCREKRDDDMIRKVPAPLAKRAAAALDIAPADFFESPERFVYRCMNGKTWVCDHGANITCAKADLRRRMQSVDEYCKSNPDAFVPMVVTGHGAIYSWKCENGKPLITDSQRVDERGFIADQWRSLD